MPNKQPNSTTKQSSMKKNKKIAKLNWSTITKKYWKDQVFFYLLTTISFLGSWFIAKNSVNFIYDLIKKGKTEEISYRIGFGESKKLTLFNFGKDLNSFLLAMGIIVLVYCAVVFAHVYFSFWFNNKIIGDIKRKLVKKALNVKGPIDQKQNLNNLVHDSRVFSDWVVYGPNQIYYVILETIVSFWSISGSPSNVIWWAFGYFFLTLAICWILNLILHRKDLIFQKHLEKQIDQETNFIRHRDLIIKKNLEESYLQKYDRVLKNTQKVANDEDLFHTSAFVIPSYSLIKYSKYFFLPFASSSSKDFIAFTMFTDLLEAIKKMIERIRGYTYYFSAQKRLNEFLAKEERNDYQKNLLISEPISNINLKKVSFSYQKNQLVLQKLDWEFKRGTVNYLTGKNGFGKSTIINLIMGLYQPNQGQILVNGKHKLNEINLIKWRAKIAYSEHENLIQSDLSTGQKQLVDLNNLFLYSENKEIIILDEADNALDENSKKKIREKLEKVSQKKIVILVSH